GHLFRGEGPQQLAILRISQLSKPACQILNILQIQRAYPDGIDLDDLQLSALGKDAIKARKWQRDGRAVTGNRLGKPWVDQVFGSSIRILIIRSDNPLVKRVEPLNHLVALVEQRTFDALRWPKDGRQSLRVEERPP